MHQHHSPSLVSSRRAHTVPAAPSIRSERAAAAAWALEHGHPLDRDALAVLLGVTAGCTSSRDGTGAIAWTTDLVDHLLWTGVVEWCRSRGVRFPNPDRVAATLTTYVAYLGTHGGLGRGSATPSQLRRAVAAHRRVQGTGSAPALRPHATVRPGRGVSAQRRGRDPRLASVTPIA